ncbi:hypothetical protein AB1N83_011076 [Pleurotus pulmonarius]
MLQASPLPRHILRRTSLDDARSMAFRLHWQNVDLRTLEASEYFESQRHLVSVRSRTPLSQTIHKTSPALRDTLRAHGTRVSTMRTYLPLQPLDGRSDLPANWLLRSWSHPRQHSRRGAVFGSSVLQWGRPTYIRHSLREVSLRRIVHPTSCIDWSINSTGSVVASTHGPPRCGPPHNPHRTRYASIDEREQDVRKKQRAPSRQHRFQRLNTSCHMTHTSAVAVAHSNLGATAMYLATAACYPALSIIPTAKQFDWWIIDKLHLSADRNIGLFTDIFRSRRFPVHGRRHPDDLLELSLNVYFRSVLPLHHHSRGNSTSTCFASVYIVKPLRGLIPRVQVSFDTMPQTPGGTNVYFQASSRLAAVLFAAIVKAIKLTMPHSEHIHNVSAGRLSRCPEVFCGGPLPPIPVARNDAYNVL